LEGTSHIWIHKPNKIIFHQKAYFLLGTELKVLALLANPTLARHNKEATMCASMVHVHHNKILFHGEDRLAQLHQPKAHSGQQHIPQLHHQNEHNIARKSEHAFCISCVSLEALLAISA
jgi:hypothetical protein